MAADALAVERLLAHVRARKEADVRDNSLIRLSGAGQCSRQLAYRVMGTATVPLDISSLATFEIGHAYHAMAQNWLVEMGWVTPDLIEVPLDDPALRIKGTADAISVRLTNDWMPDDSGTRVVFEIKSITNYPKEHFGKPLAGSFSRLEKPREYHLDQANSYAKLWNKLVDSAHLDDMFAPFDHVTRVCVIYVAKDGDGTHIPLKIFTQKVSEQRWQRLEAKFGKIWRRLDAGELPERDYDPFGQFVPCRFCEYRPYCLMGIENESGRTEEPSLFAQDEGNSDWATFGLPALDAERG